MAASDGTIQEIFELSGRGGVAVVLRRGNAAFQNGERVQVVADDEVVLTCVASVEFHSPPGDQMALFLHGVTKNQIAIGQRVHPAT